MERLVLVHGSVVGRANDMGRPAAPRRAVRARRRRAAGLSSQPAARPGRLRVGRSARGRAARARRSPRRTFVRWSHLAARRGAEARRRPLVDGHRASGDPRRRGQPCSRRVRRGRRGAVRDGARDDPETFLRRFLEAVGSTLDPPSPLPPELEQGARALQVERGPWEAEIPLDALAAAPFPKLVVSGNHSPAFDAICDVLEERLSAERVVLEGFGHTVQRHPDFNDALADFVSRAGARL